MRFGADGQDKKVVEPPAALHLPEGSGRPVAAGLPVEAGAGPFLGDAPEPCGAGSEVSAVARKNSTIAGVIC